MRLSTRLRSDPHRQTHDCRSALAEARLIGQSVRVEHSSDDIDLDVDSLAHEIERRRPVWEKAGFTVGPLTWRSRDDRVVTRDRSRYERPESVGVEVIEDVAGREARNYVALEGERGWPREGAVVAWRYGYADMDIVNWATDDVVSVVDWNWFRDVAAFGNALDRWFGRITAEAPTP